MMVPLPDAAQKTCIPSVAMPRGPLCAEAIGCGVPPVFGSRSTDPGAPPCKPVVQKTYVVSIVSSALSPIVIQVAGLVSWQLPLTQGCPMHEYPHAPQLAGSFERSVSHMCAG